MPQVKIGESIFDIPPPLGMSSFALQQRVIPIATLVLEMLAKFVSIEDLPEKEDGSLDLEKLDLEAVLPQVLPSIGRAFATLPAGELEAVTRALLADTKHMLPGTLGIPLFNSTPLGAAGAHHFDTVMQGRALDVWLLLWEAIKVWYPDFFGAAERFRAKKGTEASPSSASKTSAPAGPATSSSSAAGRRSPKSRK